MNTNIKYISINIKCKCQRKKPRAKFRLSASNRGLPGGSDGKESASNAGD